MVPNNSKSLAFAIKPTVVDTYFLLVKKESNSGTQAVSSGTHSVCLLFCETAPRLMSFQEILSHVMVTQTYCMSRVSTVRTHSLSLLPDERIRLSALHLCIAIPHF